MIRTFIGLVRCIGLSVTGLLALFLLPLSLRAQQTIHVPADQPTIQAAINAANNGDTVLVSPGTYVENINFIGKAITVTSSGGPSVTVIDGNANGSVVTFNMGETSAAVLSGLTIRNGQSNFNPPGTGSGGGIFISSASPTISGNVITGNHAVDGPGIYVRNGSPTIQNNNISGNTQCCGSGGGGGGIHVFGNIVTTASTQILNNTITGNSVANGGNGGGILADYNGNVTIQGNFIQGNSAFNNGAGIALVMYGSATLIQNVIVNSIYVTGPSSSRLAIIDNTITGGTYISVLSPPFLFTNNVLAAAGSQTAITCDPTNGALSPNFSYNDVYSTGSIQAGNCDFSTLPGNIFSDPLFTSAANGDFHLKLGSPAIDAGDSSAANLPATDFDGNPRTNLVNGATTIDMGAYEIVNTSAATINPIGLSFGSQVVGTTSSPLPTVLSSTGTTPFQISSVQTTSGYAQTNTCPVLGTPGSAPGVPNGASCSFSVAFTPPSNGLFGGLLTVNGTNGTSLQVTMNGTGFIPAPAVSLSAASLSFTSQTVGTSSSPQPLALTNTGSASLNISSITASQPFVQTNNCPAILAAAANCTINVTFQPVVSGNTTGTLTIVDNASGSPHTVSLSGTGNPVPQPVAITLVQHASKDAGTATSSSLLFPANNTAGNWIAVAIRAGHSGQSFTVKDSNGNTYHQAVQFNVTTDAPNGDTLGIFYAENIAGGANKVTLSDTISGTLRFAVLEYSGVASANSLDATAAAQGSSNAPNSGSITTSANGDLLLGADLTANGQNFTAGNGFLIEEHVPAEPNTKLIVEDGVQPASGSASASASLGVSDNWGAAIAAFKAATTSVSTAPAITSLNPLSGLPGNSVTITGANFGSTQGTSTVTFNGTPAAPTSWSAANIVVPVPIGATTGIVIVTVGGVASNGVGFAVVPPSITSLSPTSGPVGTSVTISGGNWGSSQGTSTVTFNATAATPTSWSAAIIVAPVPTGATSGNVVVTFGGVASNAVFFAVAPVITKVSPSSAPVGSPITISGTNFGSTQGSSVVQFISGFSGSFGTVTSWSDTSITVLVAAGASTGSVQVIVGQVGSNTVPFAVSPNITSLNPTTGSVKTSVTITGTSFGTAQGTSTVTFNGTLASPTSWNDALIFVPVPTGATTGNVVVTVGGLASTGMPMTIVTDTAPPTAPTSLTAKAISAGEIDLSWTASTDDVGVSGYLVERCQGVGCSTFAQIWSLPGISTSAFDSTVAPSTSYTYRLRATDAAGNLSGYSNTASATTPSVTITALNPASGTIGTSVTITGTNFGATQGTSTVTFNGTVATPTSWGATSIAVPVPPGATSGNVIVTVGGVPSNSWGFSVIPNIANLAPASGSWGTSVTISGTGLGPYGASTVTFNGITSNPTSWAARSITVPVPFGATTGPVVVTTQGGTSNGVTFTVIPTITGLTPVSGPIGTSVSIAGTAFGATQGTSMVTFNGAPATPSSWSATSITAPVPAGTTTGSVVVTVGGAASNGANFTVTPIMTSLNPASGPVGTSVAITGKSFGAAQGASFVMFGGAVATVTSWSDTSLVVLVPTGAISGNVMVFVGGVASNTLSFTVLPNITGVNPSSGTVGSVVTITGTSFGATQGASIVTFNNATSTPTSWSATSIVVPVPNGATTGNVVVAVGGFASNGVPFTVNSVAPGITLVQHTSKDAGTTSSSALTFNANNTAGNFIAVVIRAGKFGQVFNVSDTRGNVYKQAVQLNMTVDADTVGIFYAENIAGGVNTITVSDSILGTMRFAILEYSGVSTSNSLDVTAAAEGTSASPGTGNVTTTSSGDLLLGEIVTANPATFTAGSGCTIEEHVPAEPNTKLIVEDQRQTIAGAASAGASLGTSDHWGAILAAFRHP